MKTIDIKSEEFQHELKKTEKFVNKVYESKGWVPNLNEDVNEGVRMGLARNKLIYGKRYCPCFMVEGETKEEQKAADNRICPCKPAIEKEIPEDGLCHCGIFCTPAFVEAQKNKVVEETVNTQSLKLTKDEAEILLMKDQLDSDELESLIEARKLDLVSFTLVDVREQMEHNQAHIVGTDALVPTSNFHTEIEAFNDKHGEQIIGYCLAGSRSFQVQQAMRTLGFQKVSHLGQGIGSYGGEIASV